MSKGPGEVDGGLVGRASELADIRASLDQARAGAAVTVVVSGDAGVGKTALVRQLCSESTSEAWVLSGACLPLSSFNVPFLPLRSAISGAPELDGIDKPHLGAIDAAPHEAVVSIDAWLTDISQTRPVVLSIDDLHWADQGTLDVLMYLIAGSPERRLCIITTLRNGEVGAGHRLERWLADIRRMPRIHWQALGPLDAHSSGAQLAQVMGSTPHQSLLREVFSRTHGNPYLNRLIVSGLRPDTRHLPKQLPADLQSAVLRSWHGLSVPARDLTELLALGGHPATAKELDGLRGPVESRNAIEALLQEAETARITECDPDGELWWFHHPLIAEVLQHGIKAPKRELWHGMYASREENRITAGGTVDFESMAALARHLGASGQTAKAYQWTLHAAIAPRKVGGADQVLELLHSALAMHRILGHDRQEREWLLNRLRRAAARTGAMEAELEAVTMLIAEMDAANRPLEVSELMVREAQLRFSTGREDMTTGPMRKAVELAGADVGSWQYALALAELASAQAWNEEPEAGANACRALAIARRSGSPRALSYALIASAMALFNRGQWARSLELAGQGVAAAKLTGDFWALFGAIMAEANATESWTSRVYLDCLGAGRETMATFGAPHVYIATIAGYEADCYMGIGRWKECGMALRVALGSDPGPMGDAGARLTAARLALWQGRQAEAEAHLARAEELSAQKHEFMNLGFDAVRAEVYLAAGKPEAAYAVSMSNADPDHLIQVMGEWRLPLAARALADRILQAKDEGRELTALLALTDDLVRRFPTLPAGYFRNAENDELFMAFDLLYQAEVGRARFTEGNERQWVEAADACHDATLRWEEAYCSWRATQSLLHHGHSNRRLATEMLRRGLGLADELLAQPLRDALRDLAAQARIPITTPSEKDPIHGSVHVPGLTTREQEILGHVVAGLTYGQIARTLVISEKTVSSHISNMLRKTGTANRLDLTRFATRTVSGEEQP